MSERIASIIEDFIKKNPKKGLRRNPSWADTFPEEYAAARALFKKGWAPNQIAEYMGITYSTLMKQLLRDGLWVRKYRTSKKPNKTSERMKAKTEAREE
jgi:hypothetical protein